MIVNFVKIKLHNFLSFKDAEISLDSDGYTLVRGVNNNPDDFAQSNGSGKSSIWEAISWAITGETIRGTKEVKRIGAEDKDPCFVELSFNIDKNQYVVYRAKDPTTLKLIIDDKDVSGKGIRDTEKILANYLPDFNSSLLGSVIILGQGLPQRFTNNTPSGRKEVLEKLSKSDFMIYDVKNRIANRQAELNSIIKDLELAISSLNGEKNSIEFSNDYLNSRLAEIENTDYNSLDDTIYTLKENEISYNKEIEKLQVALDGVKNTCQEYRNNHVEVMKKRADAIDEVKSKFSTELNDAKLTNKERVIERNNCQQEITKLKNIKDVCPTCGQKLQGVVKPDTSELEARCEDLNIEINKLNELISDIEKKSFEEEKSVRSAYEQELAELELLIKTYEKEIKEKEVDIDCIRKKSSDCYKQRLDMENLRDSLLGKKEELMSNLAANKVKLKDIDEKILYNNNEMELKKEHLNIVNKFNTVVTRDFRGYLLQGIINYISNKSKEYSNIVFETDKIDFYLDGNNISISYDNKPYEALSGGEKQKVDLIIQFAIRDMLCSYLNFSSNIIVLDEIFDNLDMKGCQNVLNLISSKLTDVQNIFIITHRQDLEIPCDNEITIVKGEDKISRIEGAVH